MIRVHLKVHRSSRQCDRASSETLTPNALSALANKAFKVIVSCLGQASTGPIYLKMGCQL